MFNNFRKTLANFIAPFNNAMSVANEFLRYGNRAMTPGWKDLLIEDKDHYTGYSFAAIKKRSAKISRLAIEAVKTKSEKEDYVHPYLEILDESPTFTNYEFWRNANIYLDLKGWFPLMAIRNVQGDRFGNVLEFKLLNPYHVKPVYNKDNLELGGYIESKYGFQRMIPKEQIIPIKDLNPFDERKEFSMSDASVSPTFTMKTASDYTRHTLKHNINAPGIISTGIVLSNDKFKNFVNRIKNHTKGEPVFGNGDGAINWQDMNVNLSKSALKDVNEVQRDELISVYGMSKTMMGIEQSGVTRDTSKVQREEFIESEALPRIQLILDALNQDYENNAPKKNGTPKATIIVENPLKIDHEADIKETESRKKRSDLYVELVEKGYDVEKVASYVKGDIDVDELGEPERRDDAGNEDDGDSENSHRHDHDIQKNERISGQVQQQESALKNAVLNIQEKVVAQAISKVEKTVNEFEEETDVVGKADQREFENELEAALVAFYGIVLALEGARVMRNRAGKFSLPGDFKLNRQAKNYIKETSQKVAKSHVNTIINDIWKTAREASLDGKGQKEIVNLLKKKYSDVISEGRAKAIARSESNRAFTRAQYEADSQFIKQNKLDGRVYKQWRTRSENPCPFCLSLESEGLVPFDKPFRNLGDTIEADGKTLEVGFETLHAGNAHTNCSCDYELIILNDSDNEIQKRFLKTMSDLEGKLSDES